jgi:hypothetical protein
MLFVGRAVISFVIGQLIFRYVLRSPEPGTLRKWLITLGLGAAIYAFVTNAPVPATGLTIELITALAGIGAIVIYARSLIYTSRILAPDVALAQPSGEARFDMRTPPPPPEDVELLPGMDNLPDGFDGFDNDW